MDLWQLHIFCKVVQLKSFSKAGKNIHLSQPTVSSHIRDLEEHFGCRLIDRLARGAIPTKAGELLYTYARELIALRDETETALAEFHGKIRGRLVIGGSTIPGVHILPKIIGAFVKDYPEVTIALIIGDTEKIIGDTLSCDLELGIVGAKTGDKKIFQEKLIEDEMRLVIPEGHKWADKKDIPLKMLLDEPFIIREHGSGTLKSVRRSFSRAGCNIEELKITAEMGSTEAVIQGIKHNIGVSVLSTIAVSEELGAGTLKALAIKDLNLKRSFYLTRHKYRTASPLCQVFIKFLKKKLSDT
ncbi:selenium metabolism-associated LysR family transcriptional regulator [Desulfobacterales bacterium HSG2]|nr:selenium metabolism-associated LysR family transcriptional regulator [Desulfobacterales bacterium HSG2]